MTLTSEDPNLEQRLESETMTCTATAATLNLNLGSPPPCDGPITSEPLLEEAEEYQLDDDVNV